MPTLWLIEDAHWIDDASARLLRALANRLVGPPLALVSTQRPGDGSTALDSGSSLILSPLDAEAGGQIARDVGVTDLMPGQVRALVDRTGGNPLFFAESLTALGEGVDLDSVPDTAEALIATRIDALRPADRLTLRHLAVLGTEFDVDLMRPVLARLGGQTRTDLSRLGAFIERRQGKVRFRQALFQETAYAGLPYRRRATAHGAVAELLEERSAAGPSDSLGALSLHFHRAARFDKSWRYSRLAADQAASRYAHTAAAALYAQAIEAAHRIDSVEQVDVARVALELGKHEWLAGRNERALAAVRRAQRGFRGHHAGMAEALFYEGHVLSDSGAYGLAYRRLRKGVGVSEEAGAGVPGIVVVRLLVGCGMAAHRLARHRQAIRWLERALAQAEADADMLGVGNTCDMLSVALYAIRDPRCHEYGERAVRIYEALGAQEFLGHALNNLGNAAYGFGRWREAARLYERARERLLATGAEASAATTANNIADIVTRQGDLERGARLYADALAIFVAARSPYEHFVRANLAALLARDGRIDEATELFSARMKVWLPSESRHTSPTSTSCGPTRCSRRPGSTTRPVGFQPPTGSPPTGPPVIGSRVCSHSLGAARPKPSSRSQLPLMPRENSRAPTTSCSSWTRCSCTTKRPGRVGMRRCRPPAIGSLQAARDPDRSPLAALPLADRSSDDIGGRPSGRVLLNYGASRGVIRQPLAAATRPQLPR